MSSRWFSSDPMTLSSLARRPSAVATVEHICPVCHAQHQVSTVRAQMAYGRQLCCGPECEAGRRRAQRTAMKGKHAVADVPAVSSSGSWLGSALMIAILLAILAAGFALRLLRFYPHLF